jgi:hypothetical protein
VIPILIYQNNKKIRFISNINGLISQNMYTEEEKKNSPESANDGGKFG